MFWGRPKSLRKKMFVFNARPKTKGQNRFRVFHTFPQFFTLFIIFPPGLSPSKQRVLAQGEQKRRKDNKKEQDKSMLHVSCCAFVLLFVLNARPLKQLVILAKFPGLFLEFSDANKIRNLEKAFKGAQTMRCKLWN